MKKIFVASDHAGVEVKREVVKVLEDNGYFYEDLGAFDSQVKVDYPKYAKKVCDRVIENNGFGILICGSGTGMQIAANKFHGIRAAFAYDEYSAKMARKDNDANVLTLRAREFDSMKYRDIVLTFLETEFSGEERHKRRIEEISEIEDGD